MNPNTVAGKKAATQLATILKKQEAPILDEWMAAQLGAPGLRRDLIKESELREQSKHFLHAFVEAAQAGSLDVSGTPWTAVRNMVTEVSRSRARQGFTPSETATFIFSLKEPLFTGLRKEYGDDANQLFEEIWTVTVLVDRLGLLSTEAYQKTRDEVIQRQQEELLELSTPVVKLWDGILALPLIGTLDSARTQVVMESLLQKIVETGSLVAIIDITGVPTVDTLVAQHLIKTITAARLMGADCIISGIRPQIAQTIVHLGVELSNVVTKASLADAFSLALQRTGVSLRGAQPQTADEAKPGPVRQK